MTEHEGDARGRGADGRRAGLAFLAFGWVFAFAIGFLAAAPAAAIALVLFFRLCAALVRGQALS